MTHGVKGGKRVHGAKEHATLVHHIETVAKKREELNKAQKDHNEHVRELYHKHGGDSVMPPTI